VILLEEEKDAGFVGPRGGGGQVRLGGSGTTLPGGRVLPVKLELTNRNTPTMTAQAITSATSATSDLSTTVERSTGSRVLRIAAGAALVAGPVLWSAGMWTSPSASGTTDVDYITSLGRDGTLTQVSALFLHYGNLLIGLGVLAAASLVRGPRGSRLTVAGAILTALGFTSVSGMLLSDWWNLSAAQNLSIDQAAKVFGGFKDSSLLFLWDGLEVFSMIGTILLFVGLARAGVLAWWNLAVFVAGVAGLMFVPWDLPKVSAVVVLVGFAPFAMIGARLLKRAGMERR
jgi:hypothetical protein